MLHRFLTPGPWFAAKRYGIGAGRPIVWQGWVLLASYLGVLAGLGRFSAHAQGGARVSALVVFVICTTLFLLLVHKRTQGGWKWHWGRK
ncbi:hypothetical protein [Novosphingobium sp. B 225]|uniref:hypothetical protein n=1 Tax=Novosphingobium sp. B 225 TaxID=1961849 RepID=UPI000B4B09F4|nr:hypothetical protein [Novosphingobium sp. B 225]